MIALLRGRIVELAEDHLVLDVQGVGYLVAAPTRVLARLPAQGESVELLIETQLRAESITLYGFLESAERAWFRLLQNVQGVGARVALALLGVLSPDELVRTIATQDKSALTRASGVGTKLAQRILLELKDRVPELPRGAMATPASPSVLDEGADDAAAALVKLGFGRAEVGHVLARIRGRLGPTAPVQLLVREGLKELTA